MPLRSAIWRACSTSCSGRRIAIWTLLLFLFSLATRRDPFVSNPFDLAEADLCLTYSRPDLLAHQSASWLSFLNLGISTLFLFICSPTGPQFIPWLVFQG